ncbi:anti-sigma factor [Halomonas sp. I1]|uniref:anti-sigma factor n=1 Tax=Halomonas sp. I1 TaxID=393536 RepID=UPI0028DFB7C9|nr:anti-sigma factor [Halomonas sp. I1]MDT8893243.1 anti-sigma factor [Halomonas sp. I1]
MTDHDDLDMRAAEFVLGTLDAHERESVAYRRQHDTELDALIRAWESRLAPLGDEVQAITPGPDLLARIERRIEQMEADTEEARVVRLRRRLRYWQWGTGLATAAALVMALLLVTPLGREATAPPFVAVFHQDDQQPAFMLTVDLASQRLNVQPVAAEPLPDKSYQLWIKADPLGPDPRSVGVLNDDLSLDPGALSHYEPELLKNATFGISVEPAGGSPTGQPTGPAIHGYLYPTEHHL